jgi:glycosyltransferase involved in cell wall biosynthesis
MISFILPHYNDNHIVDLAISNALKSNNISEIILVDDGSDIPPRVGSYPKLKQVFHAANKGTAAAMITGLSHATQPFVYFGACGDTPYPELFNDAVPALTNNTRLMRFNGNPAGFYTGRSKWYDANINLEFITPEINIHQVYYQPREIAKYNPLIASHVTVWRKEALPQPLSCDMRWRLDWWIACSIAGSWGGIFSPNVYGEVNLTRPGYYQKGINSVKEQFVIDEIVSELLTTELPAEVKHFLKYSGQLGVLGYRGYRWLPASYRNYAATKQMIATELTKYVRTLPRWIQSTCLTLAGYEVCEKRV